jgi:GT2 family glycosyltransferase
LMRGECWRQLGGFDEDFFLYYEDVDLCRRARAAGWSVWLEPRLRAIHHRPLHSRTVPPLLRLSTRHGLLTYSAKHWPRWQSQVLAGIIKVEAWMRRFWARWQGDRHAAELFSRLGALAGDSFRGDRARARRRLDRAVRAHQAQRNGPSNGTVSCPAPVVSPDPCSAGTMAAVQ